MRRDRLGLVGIAAVALTAAAIALGPGLRGLVPGDADVRTAPPTGAWDGMTVHLAVGDVALDYPSGWRVGQYSVTSSFMSVVFYLSTDPLRDPCTRDLGLDGTVTVSCSWVALERLSLGGVLVTWMANGFPGWTFDASKGHPTTLGGRPATYEVAQPPADSACRSIGGVREIVVTAPVPDVRDNWTEVHACLAGPDPDSAELIIRHLLSTVAWVSAAGASGAPGPTILDCGPLAAEPEACAAAVRLAAGTLAAVHPDLRATVEPGTGVATVAVRLQWLGPDAVQPDIQSLVVSLTRSGSGWIVGTRE